MAKDPVAAWTSTDHPFLPPPVDGYEPWLTTVECSTDGLYGLDPDCLMDVTRQRPGAPSTAAGDQLPSALRPVRRYSSRIRPPTSPPEPSGLGVPHGACSFHSPPSSDKRRHRRAHGPDRTKVLCRVLSGR